jgi:hypothetical protein
MQAALLRRRRIAVAFTLLLTPIAVHGASLSGTIRDFEGNPLSGMPVQLTHSATGQHHRTFSDEDGSYAFDDVQDGPYDLWVNPPGFALSPFEQEGITLEGNVTLDPTLTLGLGQGIVGEEGVFSAMRAKPGEIPDLPVPMLDGHPDLNGFWMLLPDPFGERADPRPEAARIQAERAAAGFADDPGIKCLPINPNGLLGWGRFLHTGDRLVFITETSPGWRQIHLDGRDLPEDPNPTWLGHSVGRWEGDTLVVETVGFNGRGWHDGYPISERMRVRETFRRTSYGEIEYTATYDDPEVFNIPWVKRAKLELSPKQEVMETVCENNRW